ncbi:MAG: REP element-mobilizing transposase RayT [Psychromonas sp.]
MLFLSAVFAIDICAYAVMSNHTHVVLHVDKTQADGWNADEVLRHYHILHKGTLLTQKYLKGVKLSPGELISFDETVELYRQRLFDISWFMRNLNEYIAREANKEDGCTGRFYSLPSMALTLPTHLFLINEWEGRFKSQALLDETAVLACMAYVDLNPIRAKMEKTPERSKYTSIKKRTQAAEKNLRQPKYLMPFVGDSRQDMPKGIAYSLKDYCGLVEITGRCIREDKTGATINSSYCPILERLGLDSQ